MCYIYVLMCRAVKNLLTHAYANADEYSSRCDCTAFAAAALLPCPSRVLFNSFSDQLQKVRTWNASQYVWLSHLRQCLRLPQQVQAAASCWMLFGLIDLAQFHCYNSSRQDFTVLCAWFTKGILSTLTP